MATGTAIVLGVDLDTPSAHALREALRVAAERRGATLHVLHAITDVAPGARGGVALRRAASRLATVPAQLREWVAGVVDALDDWTDVPIVLHTRIGKPAAVLAQLAADVDAELVVIGTHARRGLKRVALGSVAATIVRTARCPVLVARPTDYTGIARSPVVEPLCDACVAARASSGGSALWCEVHAAEKSVVHVLWSVETLSPGRHDASVIPPS